MPVLGVQDLHHRFGKSSEVLRGITLNLEPETITAIMGPPGSGKSTLLNCMSGLLQPTSGQILYRGSVIALMSQGKKDRLRRTSWGFIFQSYNLVDALTAADNVKLPALFEGHRMSDEVAYEALSRVGLAGLERRYPDQLSGGQYQRVAIARALATQRDIVFADEPTGALDSESRREVMQHLTAIPRSGSTVVLVTHDPTVAAAASRIVFLYDGKLAGKETGLFIGLSPEEVKLQLASLRGILSLLSGLAIVVSGFLMWSAIKQAVSFRQRELALMRLVGASRFRLACMVSLECFVMGLVVALPTAVLGALLAPAVFSGLQAIGFFGRSLQVEFGFAFGAVLIVAFALAAVAGVAGFLAARSATRGDLVTAINPLAKPMSIWQIFVRVVLATAGVCCIFLLDSEALGPSLVLAIPFFTVAPLVAIAPLVIPAGAWLGGRIVGIFGTIYLMSLASLIQSAISANLARRQEYRVLASLGVDRKGALLTAGTEVLIVQGVAGFLVAAVLVALGIRFAATNGTSPLAAIAAAAPVTGFVYGSVLLIALGAQLVGSRFTLAQVSRK